MTAPYDITIDLVGGYEEPDPVEMTEEEDTYLCLVCGFAWSQTEGEDCPRCDVFPLVPMPQPETATTYAINTENFTDNELQWLGHALWSIKARDRQEMPRRADEPPY